MILIEGLMLVPPERGTIIGRAAWKPRYVVFGTGAHLQTHSDLLDKANSKKGKLNKASSSKSNVADGRKSSDDDGLFISIYKAKGDWEYIAQHPISAFKSCGVRSLSHKKQSTPLPTLMLELKPDSVTEKQRKRRSSRTGALTSNKDAQWADTLLFRSVPEDQNNIYDWEMVIKPRLQSQQVDDSYEETPMGPMGPMSPLTPLFTAFTNPFSPKEPRPSSRNGNPDQQARFPLQSTHQYQPNLRERPSALISPSPSIRSHRSDLSSRASSSHPPTAFASHNHNNTTLPTDLPSPVSVSCYDNLIEGWTSAQGRCSGLSYHTRRSNSIASAIPSLTSPITASPGPRETILDRAFQMRCIPGSEILEEKDEEKISSIARFEAIMREHDAKLLQKSATSAADGHVKYDEPDWELEEESDESDNEDPGAKFLEELDGHDVLMPTPAQRALDYIAGRQTHAPLRQRSSSSARPISPTSSPDPCFNRGAINALHSGSGSTHQTSSSTIHGLRPRAETTSFQMRRNSRPSSLAIPQRFVSTPAVPSLKDSGSGGSSGSAPSKVEKENEKSSSTSTKRLSFHEFARRLSSTSSLLLVQTNASSNSGRGNSFKERDESRRGSVSDFGTESPAEMSESVFPERRGSRSNIGVSLRGGGGGGGGQKLDQDTSKKCSGGFRQIGVFGGGEGGFL
ncbi:hypothetical protein DSL72_008911 [Monilinia vaccinii-corymbosi]|uniref:Uncharacterized protein n=1 Tax=Monilinia vaccinii-corymbosi TaxID=61207 RepID=A0A8A3PSK8_9HELO|nr:hypothetical protein DSL72_008911 [Monilinia vaccinii-corymbosi]